MWAGDFWPLREVRFLSIKEDEVRIGEIIFGIGAAGRTEFS
jgi:hypothetical protein